MAHKNLAGAVSRLLSANPHDVGRYEAELTTVGRIEAKEDAAK